MNVQEGEGPKAWPVLGALPEILLNYDRMHDWLLENFERAGLTFAAPMPTNTYFYTADPAVCEYILKTNFSNYPKVTHPLDGFSYKSINTVVKGFLSLSFSFCKVSCLCLSKLLLLPFFCLQHSFRH